MKAEDLEEINSELFQEPDVGGRRCAAGRMSKNETYALSCTASGLDLITDYAVGFS